VEMLGCGRHSNKTAFKSVRERFKTANKADGHFFVPLPCLFELGDHFADVGHDELRRKFADNLLHTVRSSLNTTKPWTITPTGLPEDILPSRLERFVPLSAKEKIGLVDTFTLNEALRLKQSLDTYKARIHIWTNDRNLKSKEPEPSRSRVFGDNFLRR
jgi:hypothetical protein